MVPAGILREACTLTNFRSTADITCTDNKYGHNSLREDKSMKRPERLTLTLTALSSISLALICPSAQAFDFGSGDFTGSFNSSLSLGASWRMEGANDDFLFHGNTGEPLGTGASVSTEDDGNLNYGAGDMTSLVFKGLHDLQLNYKSVGFFTRFKYWYDYELEEGNVAHGNSVNGYTPDQPLDDDGFSTLGSFKGIALLDAYFFTSFNAGAVPIDLRIGRQVVSWGESTFISNGINAANPVDVTALRRPGAELKEALLPVGMIYGSFGLTTNLNFEAFYQYEWARTELDACGTFFSHADPAPQGCNALTLTESIPDAEKLNPDDSLYHTDDDEPSNGGQYGVSLKYFAEALGSTEFGLYYMNYHSRTPFYAGVNGNIENPPVGVPLLDPNIKPRYTYQFPEDIHLFGLSFNTNLAGWSVGGEISYRPNMPLAINTIETTGAIAAGIQAPWSTQLDAALAAGNGGTVDGYDDVAFTQMQLTLIKSYYNVMGAGSFNLVGEIGGNYIDGMEDGQRYGRSSTFGIGAFEPVADPITGAPVSCNSTTAIGLTPNTVAQNCTNRGYITDYAWGYRLRASWNYSSVFWGVNLTPSVVWSHDVEGVSPAPNFNQGSKAIALALKGDYLQKYTADISYVTFFDGDYNTKTDRDFLALSVGVSF